jgi:Transposase DDE domain
MLKNSNLGEFPHFLSLLAMHNLQSNFDKILSRTKHHFGKLLNSDGNFGYYSRKPKLSDIEVISLALTAEALAIDSENHLFTIIHRDYPQLAARLSDRTNYNKRRRRLQPRIALLPRLVSDELPSKSSVFVIDSIPIPICMPGRNLRVKICHEDIHMLPTISYNSLHKFHFKGFKMQLIIQDNGIPYAASFTTASAHDSTFLPKLAAMQLSECEVLGDKGYISTQQQLTLFEVAKIQVITPLRNNMDQLKSKWSKAKGYTRKRIETLFSQLCDQTMLKRNYAKSKDGLFARVLSKLGAISILQSLNFTRERPINLIKSALDF